MGWVGGEEEGTRGGCRRLGKRMTKGIGAWGRRSVWCPREVVAGGAPPEVGVVRGARGAGREVTVILGTWTGSCRYFGDTAFTYGEVAAARSGNFRPPEDSSAYLIAICTEGTSLD